MTYDNLPLHVPDAPHASREIECPNCGGDGTIACGMCDGAGLIITGDDYYDYKVCDVCLSCGDIPCPECGGKGTVEAEIYIRD